jgi:glycosyltransferase involved in cell wall biosynthesis
MKVLMLTPDAQMIDRRIIQEARTLVRAGHHVILLAGFECAHAESFEIDGIAVHRFRYDWDDERLKRLRRYLVKHPRVTRFVNRAFLFLARRFFPVAPFDRFIIEQGLRFRADVVHVHDLPALQAGAVLAATWGVPLVYDAHELYYAQEVLAPRIRRAYFQKEKRYIRRAQAIITVNEFIAGLMQERYNLGPIHVLYNCADASPSFDPERERDRSPLRTQLPGTGPVLLYQGWLSEERNIGTLIEALVHVPPPARLAVIGYGDCLEALRQLAQQRGVADRVHFLGKVPSDDMLNYTAGADLGLIPYLPIDDNHRYCSPNKFFEFVQACVPILAHDLPFFRQMAKRHGVVACTDYTSAESLGRAITALLQSGASAQMRRRCFEARKVLNWSVEGEKLLTLYERLGVVSARQEAA